MNDLGCLYYPECWGIERVAIAIQLMKSVGMNIVRMGEFAWSQFEKRESEFDFSLFRETLDPVSKTGIQAMRYTPSAALPAWLTHDYPDTLFVGVSGVSDGRFRHSYSYGFVCSPEPHV